jgi:hypothetical protein
MVYSVNFKDCEQTDVGQIHGQATRHMKKYVASSTTFEQQKRADCDTNNGKLRRSSRIRGKKNLVCRNYRTRMAALMIRQ